MAKFYRFWDETEKYFHYLEQSFRLGIPDTSELGRPRVLDEFVAELVARGRNREALDYALQSLQSKYASRETFRVAIKELRTDPENPLLADILEAATKRFPNENWPE